MVSASLPKAQVGVPFNVVVSVRGGRAPYQFNIANGTLPQGLSLNAETGTISGTPSAPGTYNFQIAATDSPRTDRGEHHFLLAVRGSTPRPNVTVTVSPSASSLSSGGTQQFTAMITGTSDVAVTWSSSTGTVSNTGKFVAPQVTSAVTVTVTATCTTYPGSQGSAAVTVVPTTTNPPQAPPPASSPPPVIGTTSLPGAVVGSSYSVTLKVSGGRPPYAWSTASAAALPQGLALNSSSGTIGGTPTQSGAFSITAKVTDSASKSAIQTLALSVSAKPPSPLNSTGFDGPAELPRGYVQSAMVDTPAPGQTISLSAGGNLQSALNSANCGDTINLQAGATFSGTFTFPAKNCDDNHWIIVRTSSPDSSLPPEGTRMTPCYAGFASYPNRPAYPCQNPQNVLAKLNNPAIGTSGPVIFSGDHYRLVGLEITRANVHGLVYDLITAAVPAANHIVIDRVWAHGIEQSGNFPQNASNSTETKRGVNVGQSNTLAVIDSYFSDFYCDGSLGGCDSQAIAGGWGSTANSGWGKWKIVNNHLEGAAEGILLGGAGGPINTVQDVPCDVEIRRNLFFKPLSWASGNRTTTGWPVEKNGFEFKTGCRILVEGNLIQNVWYMAQVGQAIVIAPKNQSGGTPPHGTCPGCIVTDLIVRNNKSYNTASGVGIFNSQDATCTSSCDSLGMHRIVFHDNLHEYINLPQSWGVDGYEIASNSGSPIDQLWIFHNTITTSKRSAFQLGGPSPSNQTNIVVRDNIIAGGTYGTVSTNSGGCQGAAITALAITGACWSPFTFTNNAIVGSTAAKWPTNNFFPADGNRVGFVNYNNGNGGDYHLSSGSPYKNAATDGKDLGADIDAVNSAITCVY